MLKDSERYILTTDKVSVIQDVLSLLFAAVKSERDITPDTCPSLEAFAKGNCDRMILELRRPKEPSAGIRPWVRRLQVSRLGRAPVVTGDATSSEIEILNEIEVLRHPHFPSQHLTSRLRIVSRTLFETLRPAQPPV